MAENWRNQLSWGAQCGFPAAETVPLEQLATYNNELQQLGNS
jgi:hypothetical protein